MFEFMTIRELYEIVMSGSHVEQDSMEYVQLQGLGSDKPLQWQAWLHRAE